MNVLHFTRELVDPPSAPAVPGIRVRNFEGTDDIRRWLEIRRQAFADQTPRVRPWTEGEFLAELLEKSWWHPERLWFAECRTTSQAVGTVTLAERGVGGQTVPSIHWLAVCPTWRRRGIARLLVAAAEQYCWDHGLGQIALETHRNWSAAVALYCRLGYAASKANR